MIADIKQDLSVQFLYTNKNLNRPIILFRLLREYLILKGFQYTTDSNCSLIMYRLVDCFFDSEENEIYAKQKLVNTKIPEFTATALRDNKFWKTRSPEEMKIAQSKESRFKKEETFFENIGEDKKIHHKILGSCNKLSTLFRTEIENRSRYFWGRRKPILQKHRSTNLWYIWRIFC